jgi:hypothetical protein
MLSNTAIDHGSSRSTGKCLPIVFVNSDVHLYRFCSLYPSLPAWKQGAEVRIDLADQRKIGLNVGRFRVQFEHFRYAPLVHLQVLKIVNRSRGGFSNDQ